MLVPLLLAGCLPPESAIRPRADDAGGEAESEADPSRPPNVNTGSPNQPSGPSWLHDPRLAGCTLTAETDAGDYGNTVDYDAEGRAVATKAWWPDGGRTGFDRTLYEWDDADCLTATANGTTPYWTASCDAWGNPTVQTWHGGTAPVETVATYTYDDLNRPIAATSQTPDQPTYTFAYAWDGAWISDWYMTSDDADDPMPGVRFVTPVREDGRVDAWRFQVCGSRGVDACVDLLVRTFEYDEDGRVLGFTELEYMATGTVGADPTNELLDERVAVATQGDDPRVPMRFDYVSGNPQGEQLFVFTLTCE